MQEQKMGTILAKGRSAEPQPFAPAATTWSTAKLAGAAALALALLVVFWLFVRRGTNVVVEPNVDMALTTAVARAQPNDMVLVTGSLFLVGEALVWWANLRR